MKREELMKRNVKFTLIGAFFTSLSIILVSYFLPYYLKEKGLNILQIGFLFTLGLIVGGFLVSTLFARILRSIKLRTGLVISSVFSFIQAITMFVLPNNLGSIITEGIDKIQGHTYRISTDVSFQHNSSKKDHRKVSSYFLIADSGAHAVGLLLSILLITYLGFRYSFLIFAFFAIPALVFFLKVKEDTRFKIKNRKKIKLSKINFNLKLLLLSELIYWLGLAASWSLVVTFLVTDYLHGGLKWIGYLFFALQSTIVLVTLLTQKFLDKRDLLKTSIFGMVILLLSAILIIISKNIFIVLFSFILEGIGAGIWVPSKMAIYWKLTKPELRETISGQLSGWRNFANTLGPLMGGLLVTWLGILAPFYLKAIISIISILIYIYLLFKINN